MANPMAASKGRPSFACASVAMLASIVVALRSRWAWLKLSAKFDMASYFTVEFFLRYGKGAALPALRSPCSHLKMAEREGFEPPRPREGPNGFQDRRFRPLSHLSACRQRRWHINQVSADVQELFIFFSFRVHGDHLFWGRNLTLFVMNISIANLPRVLGDILILPQERALANRWGKSLRLRRREYQLLNLLASHQRQVIDRLTIEETVWQYGSFAGSNTIEVHLSALRQKLRQLSRLVRIETVRGVGYRLIA